MDNKRLVIGGPLDGQTLFVESEILKYPTFDINDDDFIYRREDFGVSSGGESKKYQFLVPKDWDMFQVMDHMVKRYGDAIPIKDF